MRCTAILFGLVASLLASRALSLPQNILDCPLKEMPPKIRAELSVDIVKPVLPEAERKAIYAALMAAVDACVAREGVLAELRTNLELYALTMAAQDQLGPQLISDGIPLDLIDLALKIGPALKTDVRTMQQAKLIRRVRAAMTAQGLSSQGLSGDTWSKVRYYAMARQAMFEQLGMLQSIERWNVESE